MAAAPRIVVFDLDGTLVETHRDIAASIAHVRSLRGMPPLPEDAIPPLLGWGVEHLLSRALGIEDAAAIASARREYAAHHAVHCADHARLYDGAAETLGALRAAGVGVGLLSNKPHEFCLRLLDALAIRGHFHAVFGADAVPWKKPDPRGLLHAIAETARAAGLPADPAGALYVGDSAVDIEAARAAGCAAAFVRTGYGRIEDHAPDHAWDDLRGLRELFAGEEGGGRGAPSGAR